MTDLERQYFDKRKEIDEFDATVQRTIRAVRLQDEIFEKARRNLCSSREGKHERGRVWQELDEEEEALLRRRDMSLNERDRELRREAERIRRRMEDDIRETEEGRQ